MDKFKQFIDTLRSKGKSDDEIAKLLAGAQKFSAMELFSIVMMVLTDEEMTQVGEIADDTQAQQKMIELFQAKAGITLEELMSGIRDGVIEQALKALS